MLDQLLTRDCVIVRRTPSGETDDYGNAVPGEELVEAKCYLDQVRRSEPGTAGELSVTDWLIVLPADTDLDTGDGITVDGETYEVVGGPAHQVNPRMGIESHVEATLRRTAGEVGS